MGVGILAKRVVLELGSSTNFVYSLNGAEMLPRFLEEWIPKEEAYFQTFGIQEICDIVLSPVSA